MNKISCTAESGGCVTPLSEIWDLNIMVALHRNLSSTLAAPHDVLDNTHEVPAVPVPSATGTTKEFTATRTRVCPVVESTKGRHTPHSQILFRGEMLDPLNVVCLFDTSLQ